MSRFLRCLMISVLFASPASAATFTVDVGPGFSFNPATITVAAGDTVVWNFVAPNHTTTSDATTGVDAWNSGAIAPHHAGSRTRDRCRADLLLYGDVGSAGGIHLPPCAAPSATGYSGSLSLDDGSACGRIAARGFADAFVRTAILFHRLRP